jgi:hypothetical protein
MGLVVALVLLVILFALLRSEVDTQLRLLVCDRPRLISSTFCSTAFLSGFVLYSKRLCPLLLCGTAVRVIVSLQVLLKRRRHLGLLHCNNVDEISFSCTTVAFVSKDILFHVSDASIIAKGFEMSLATGRSWLCNYFLFTKRSALVASAHSLFETRWILSRHHCLQSQEEWLLLVCRYSISHGDYICFVRL